MKYQPKYETSIEGRKIWVFDNLCSPEESGVIAMNLENSPFIRSEVARPDTAAFRHFVLNLNANQLSALPVYHRSLEAVFSLTGQRFKAYRAYCNLASYGDMLFTHTDCLPGSTELTVLMYACHKWDVEWGGETMFYNSEDDCVYACTPKPGRVVIFDGAIKHVGRPPNRVCYASRFTLAFKLEIDTSS
ncbi:2OG-Fe(II) oxygenase family protein [Rheinheimera fenheensis]|uniref:2OG-Fe(II) oxygenase family protein n=1 Tax=Rheinheimera fenheensis TaxID=3152295 RepID=UPI003260AB7B